MLASLFLVLIAAQSSTGSATIDMSAAAAGRPDQAIDAKAVPGPSQKRLQPGRGLVPGWIPIFGMDPGELPETGVAHVASVHAGDLMSLETAGVVLKGIGIEFETEEFEMSYYGAQFRSRVSIKVDVKDVVRAGDALANCDALNGLIGTSYGLSRIVWTSNLGLTEFQTALTWRDLKSRDGLEFDELVLDVVRSHRIFEDTFASEDMWVDRMMVVTRIGQYEEPRENEVSLDIFIESRPSLEAEEVTTSWFQRVHGKTHLVGQMDGKLELRKVAFDARGFMYMYLG